MDWASRLTDRQKDWFGVATILVILLVRFYKTIFLFQSLSKLFLVAHWDSFLYPLRQGNSFGMDPSFMQLLIPYEFLIADYWHHGLPLWNQWSGFGMPLLGDPQTLVFSPFNIFFTLFTCIHTWDLILIIQLGIAAISIYFLSRELELNFTASIIAALIFIFCPWLQCQIELLGMGTCLTPFVFLYFCRMAKKGTFGNIALAGITAAFDILSAHPEIAFTTILSASVFTLLIAFYNNDSQHSLVFVLRSALVRIALAGTIAFGLSAPMFIPFLEYAFNCTSYKLEMVAGGLSWQAILANYLYPFQPKASLFFGTLSWWGILSTLYFLKNFTRFAKPLLIFLALSIIAVTRPFFFEYLFKIPPLCKPYATYWLPEYFLSISLLSGLGCSYLIDKCFANNLSWKSKRLQLFILSGLMLMAIPLLYFPWHHNPLLLQFDSTFEPTRFNWRTWLFNTVCASLSIFALCFVNNKSKKWKAYASALFLVLGLSSLMLASSNSLIVRPTFEYPKTLPFKITNPDEDRFISVGNHLFRPSTNLIYKISLIQSWSPIFPKGVMNFTKECGAEQFPQIFPPIISPLLNVSGVNKILSEQPILDGNLVKNLCIFKSIRSPEIAYANALEFSNINVLHDRKTNSVFVLAKITPLSQTVENYHLVIAIEDLNGNSISYIEPQAILSSLGTQEILSSGILPKDIKHWAVSIRVMQDRDCTFLHPTKISFGRIRDNYSWLLANSELSQHYTEIDNDRFKLVFQQGSILEYEDKTAFSRHFFVSKIVWTKNNPDALSYLKTHTNQLSDIAVLEDWQKKQFDNLIKNVKPDSLANKPNKTDNSSPLQTKDSSYIIFDKSGTIKKIDFNQKPDRFVQATDYSLSVDTKQPAFLITSEIYYPGWKAYIDGKESKIFCADYLFRGVLMPQGHHILRFIYQPISVLIGLILFGITSISLIVLYLKKHFFK